MSIGFPWYVVKGDINIENFKKFRTVDRGFIWRGYTYENQMLPAATEYNEYNEKFKKMEDRTNICYPKAEIQRVSQKLYELNKLKKFPFEIPLLIRKVLFPGFYQPENILFKEMQIKEFPDNSLAQAMAIVQDEFRGTSLLDFTMNKFKALYFAIGNDKTFSKDSYIFGLNVPYFEATKGNLNGENSSSEYRDTFDILYPSYFMNDRIAQQEGVFLYQKFKINDDGYITGNKKYLNIITFFNEHFKKDQSRENPFLFKEITLDDFLKLTEKEGDKPIFFVSLKVPINEKKKLKKYLKGIGITEKRMMNSINKKIFYKCKTNCT